MKYNIGYQKKNSRVSTQVISVWITIWCFEYIHKKQYSRLWSPCQISLLNMTTTYRTFYFLMRQHFVYMDLWITVIVECRGQKIHMNWLSSFITAPTVNFWFSIMHNSHCWDIYFHEDIITNVIYLDMLENFMNPRWKMRPFTFSNRMELCHIMQQLWRAYLTIDSQEKR